MKNIYLLAKAAEHTVDLLPYPNLGDFAVARLASGYAIYEGKLTNRTETGWEVEWNITDAPVFLNKVEAAKHLDCMRYDHVLRTWKIKRKAWTPKNEEAKVVVLGLYRS